MTIYCINYDNYHGEDYIEYYRNENNAIKKLKELFEEGQTKEDFVGNIKDFSYFDSNYNEYSTYIYYYETTLDKLFSD